MKVGINNEKLALVEYTTGVIAFKRIVRIIND
jgi:hypothetical protein